RRGNRGVARNLVRSRYTRRFAGAGCDAYAHERRRDEPVSDPNLEIIGLPPLPEIRPGDDLIGAIGDAVEASALGLRADDVLVVTQKVVSKAEGRLVDLRTIEP